MHEAFPPPLRALLALAASLGVHAAVWSLLGRLGPPALPGLEPWREQPVSLVTLDAERGWAPEAERHGDDPTGSTEAPLASPAAHRGNSATARAVADPKPTAEDPDRIATNPAPRPASTALPADGSDERRRRGPPPTPATDRRAAATAAKPSRGGAEAMAGGERRPEPESPLPARDPEVSIASRPETCAAATPPADARRPTSAPSTAARPESPPAPASPPPAVEAAPLEALAAAAGRAANRRAGNREADAAVSQWLEFARSTGRTPAHPPEEARFVGSRDTLSPVMRRALTAPDAANGLDRGDDPRPAASPPPPSPPPAATPPLPVVDREGGAVPTLPPPDGFRLAVTDEPPAPPPPRPRPAASPPAAARPAPAPTPPPTPPEQPVADGFWDRVSEPAEAPSATAPPAPDAPTESLPHDLEVSMVAAASVRATPLGRWAETVDDALRARWRWPDHLRALDVGGSVEVGFTVRRDGRVVDVHLIDGSGTPELDYAALAAVPERVEAPPDGVAVPYRWVFRYGRTAR